MRLIDRLPLTTLSLITLTLGLAPFVPEPHVWRKIQMLADGNLRRPIDHFDLLLHGTPWLLLFAKLTRLARLRLGNG